MVEPQVGLNMEDHATHCVGGQLVRSVTSKEKAGELPMRRFSPLIIMMRWAFTGQIWPAISYDQALKRSESGCENPCYDLLRAPYP